MNNRHRSSKVRRGLTEVKGISLAVLVISLILGTSGLTMFVASFFADRAVARTDVRELINAMDIDKRLGSLERGVGEAAAKIGELPAADIATKDLMLSVVSRVSTLRAEMAVESKKTPNVPLSTEVLANLRVRERLGEIEQELWRLDGVLRAFGTRPQAGNGAVSPSGVPGDWRETLRSIRSQCRSLEAIADGKKDK